MVGLETIVFQNVPLLRKMIVLMRTNDTEETLQEFAQIHREP